MKTCFTVNAFTEDTPVSTENETEVVENGGESIQAIAIETEESTKTVQKMTSESMKLIVLDSEGSFSDMKYSNKDLKVDTYTDDVNNTITASTKVGDNNVLLAACPKMLYARKAFYDNDNNLKYDERAITSPERISIPLNEQRSYALFFDED